MEPPLQPSLPEPSEECSTKGCRLERDPADARTLIPVQPQWPDPPAKEAYDGLAGVIAQTIAPHTEADPVAILVQILVAIGSVIGRNAHYRVEADDHYLNLFAALVGSTGKGRKGTSWGYVYRILAMIDEVWVKDNIGNGLSTGEGLIHAVRDPIVNAKGEIVDPGVEDKRLLVLESEFARVLRVIARERNTLSAVVRDAWDSRGELRVMTKSSPERATEPHISIIAHITKEELNNCLDDNEVANGFGNRFLWVCCKRSKSLPRAGKLPEEALGPLVERLLEAIAHATNVERMTRDQAAQALWNEEYTVLSEGKAGLLGAMIGRAEAQVLRLSAVYAVLDGSSVVSEGHLRAALALWRYCEASATFVFGTALGDPIADQLLQELRAQPRGMTREEIRDHFSRHKSKEQISRALDLLRERGLATVSFDKTGGRAAERWSAVV